KHAESNPRGALVILNAVAPVATDAAKLRAAQRKLLERVVPLAPENVEFASQLAVVYEEDGEIGRCEKLLAPLEPKLRVSEGARILGRIYAAQGKFDKAYALLHPYSDEHLQKFQSAMQAFEKASTDAQKRVLAEVDNGHGAGFPYQRFQSAPQAEKDAIVHDF